MGIRDRRGYRGVEGVEERIGIRELLFSHGIRKEIIVQM